VIYFCYDCFIPIHSSQAGKETEYISKVGLFSVGKVVCKCYLQKKKELIQKGKRNPGLYDAWFPPTEEFPIGNFSGFSLSHGRIFPKINPYLARQSL
jgi:hypothetical protein